MLAEEANYCWHISAAGTIGMQAGLVKGAVAAGTVQIVGTYSAGA
jgi:hypothetical protein